MTITERARTARKATPRMDVSRRLAEKFAAKWFADAHVEQPTDDALRIAFERCVLPPKAELYPTIREHIAGWAPRPPYEVGGSFKALFPGSRGTSLATFTVTACTPNGRNRRGELVWRLAGVCGDETTDAIVRLDGTDTNHYIERLS